MDRSPGQQECEGSSYKTTPPLDPSWNRVLLNAIPAAQSRRSHFCLFPSQKESERIPEVFTSRFNQINYKRWAAAAGFPVAVGKMALRPLVFPDAPPCAELVLKHITGPLLRRLYCSAEGRCDGRTSGNEEKGVGGRRRI